MTLRRYLSAGLFALLAVALTTAVLTKLMPSAGAASNPKIAGRVVKETANGNATEAQKIAVPVAAPSGNATRVRSHPQASLLAPQAAATNRSRPAAFAR